MKLNLFQFNQRQQINGLKEQVALLTVAVARLERANMKKIKVIAVTDTPKVRKIRKHRKHQWRKVCGICGKDVKGHRGLGVHKATKHGIRSARFVKKHLTQA